MKNFVESKNEVLLALYRMIRENDGQIWFGPSDIEEHTDSDLSRSFIVMCLESWSLSKHMIGETPTQSDFPVYKLTDKGITNAESVITKLDIWDDFNDRNISVNEIIKSDGQADKLTEIKQSFDALEEKLQAANDIGELNEDEIESAKVEVRALRLFFDGTKVRAGVAAQQARKTLGWIGKKAAGTSVAELTKKLLGLVLSYLGYGG